MSSTTDDARPADGDTRGLSRRGFLKGVGGSAVGATVMASGAGLPGLEGLASVAFGAEEKKKFGRMFDLPPFAVRSDALAAALIDIGMPGGIMDAADFGGTPSNPDNPTNTAGTTFFGQFLDHDVTRDETSVLGEPTNPKSVKNARTASFDLDSVYGDGPDGSPELYAPDTAKLRIEFGGLFEDLPRRPDLSAIVSDNRNDENLIICGLQCAMIKFHNAVVDRVRAEGFPGNAMKVFKEARKRVQWHYQWIIVHQFLPQILGQSVVNGIFQNGRQFYTPNKAFMPVEFQAAAYRMGHSMVRPAYRANRAGNNGAAFAGRIFNPLAQGQADPIDLRGGARAPRRFIGWEGFFDFGDGLVQRNKIVDTHLSTPLFDLPLGTIREGQPPTSLATRNLLRHVTWSLPSGQSIAAAMGTPALSAADLSELSVYNLNLQNKTPLWFYILKEAQVQNQGLRLGAVGGTIVGEVFIGMLQLDSDSYLNSPSPWTPTLPTRSGVVNGTFEMQDLLTIAGVDPTSRGQ